MAPYKAYELTAAFCLDNVSKTTIDFSILKGIKLQPLSLIQFKPIKNSHKIIYKVIDGKQRLSTIIAFYKNEFAIEHLGHAYFFKDLNEEAQREIAFLSLSVDIGYEYPDELISDADKIAWFELINFSGTAQDVEHLNKLKL